jgi:hypothetical protein
MSLESTTPPTIAKRNPNTHATHNTLPANTKEDQILLKTFQNYMNKIIQLNTSLEKEDSYSMKIIKPLVIIVGLGALWNTRMTKISFSTLNCMVEAIKPRNKMTMASINKMITTNLDIVECHAQAQEKLLKLEINYLKSKNVEQIDYFKYINVEMNNTQKNMVQTIFGLT